MRRFDKDRDCFTNETEESSSTTCLLPDGSVATQRCTDKGSLGAEVRVLEELTLGSVEWNRADQCTLHIIDSEGEETYQSGSDRFESLN